MCNLAKKAREFCAYQILPLNQTCLRYVSKPIFSGNRSSRPKVIPPEVRSPGTRAMLPEINSHAFNPKSCCSKFYRVFNHEEK